MARYSSIITLKGNLGGLSFYTNKNGDQIVRSKWGPDKERLAKDPKYEKIRSQQKEFSDCSAACKLFRRNFLEFVRDASDSRVTSRITRMMVDIKNLDNQARGLRSVAGGLKNKESIKKIMSFNWNKNFSLGSVLLLKPHCDLVKGTVSLKNFKAGRDIKFPKGATHVTVAVATGIFDFAKGKSRLLLSEMEVIPKTAAEKTITFKTKLPAKSTGLKIMVLRIGFVQDLGRIQYVLSGGKSNVAEVVGVGK